MIKFIYFSEPFSNCSAFFFYRLQRPFNLAVMPLCNAAMPSREAEMITFLENKAGTDVRDDSSMSNWLGRRREIIRTVTH